MTRPTLRAATLVLAAAALLAAGGCATVNTVSSEVSSFGEWPANRATGTYAFERLPSQEARAEQQGVLEASARSALERAGFKAATEPGKADVLVQLGLRATRQERSAWDEPYWPRWSLGYGRGVHWGMSAQWPSAPRVDREVALLLRDRASGKALYESRAVNSGFSSVDATVLTAMFDAALKDFPKPAVSPRRVDITLPSATAPSPEQTKILR